MDACVARGRRRPGAPREEDGAFTSRCPTLARACGAFAPLPPPRPLPSGTRRRRRRLRGTLPRRHDRRRATLPSSGHSLPRRGGHARSQGLPHSLRTQLAHALTHSPLLALVLSSWASSTSTRSTSSLARWASATLATSTSQSHPSEADFPPPPALVCSARQADAIAQSRDVSGEGVQQVPTPLCCDAHSECMSPRFFTRPPPVPKPPWIPTVARRLRRGRAARQCGATLARSPLSNADAA